MVGCDCLVSVMLGNSHLCGPECGLHNLDVNLESRYHYPRGVLLFPRVLASGQTSLATTFSAGDGEHRSSSLPPYRRGPSVLMHAALSGWGTQVLSTSGLGFGTLMVREGEVKTGVGSCLYVLGLIVSCPRVFRGQWIRQRGGSRVWYGTQHQDGPTDSVVSR